MIIYDGLVSVSRRSVSPPLDTTPATLSPMSRAWRIGDLVKSFVPIMLTDAVHPGSCYAGLCAQQDLLVISRGGNMTISREYRVEIYHGKRHTFSNINVSLDFGYEILKDWNLALRNPYAD